MEAKIFNSKNREIGRIYFYSVSELSQLFAEYIVGTVRWYGEEGFKMSAKTLKEVKSVVDSHSFLRRDYSVTIF